MLGMWVIRTPLGQKRNTKPLQPRVCPVQGRGPVLVGGSSHCTVQVTWGQSPGLCEPGFLVTDPT